MEGVDRTGPGRKGQGNAAKGIRSQRLRLGEEPQIESRDIRGASAATGSTGSQNITEVDGHHLGGELDSGLWEGFRKVDCQCELLTTRLFGDAQDRSGG